MRCCIRVVKSFVRFWGTFFFLLLLFFKEGFTDFIRKHSLIQSSKKKKIKILANGPSLKKDLQDISSDFLNNSPDTDYFVLNDFVDFDAFSQLKPRFYVLSDPMFFIPSSYRERGLNVINKLQDKVTWKMNLYIPYCYRKSQYLKRLLINSNINIVCFHSIPYMGLNKFRMYIYRKGLGNGEFGTVALNAIYISILLGFKRIELYGVDHNFLEGLWVDSSNQLFYKYNHAFSKTPILKPVVHHHTGKLTPYGVSSYLKYCAHIFDGHLVMNQFAETMDVKIINCTKDSFIDAYNRI